MDKINISSSCCSSIDYILQLEYQWRNCWQRSTTTYRHVIKFAACSKLEFVCMARSVKLGPRTEAFQPWNSTSLINTTTTLCGWRNGHADIEWASCQIRKIASAHAPGMPGTFSPSSQVSDPDMHHGTCVTHVPWCMPGSLTSGFLLNWRRGETFPAFPAHAQPAIFRIW